MTHYTANNIKQQLINKPLINNIGRQQIDMGR